LLSIDALIYLPDAFGVDEIGHSFRFPCTSLTPGGLERRLEIDGAELRRRQREHSVLPGTLDSFRGDDGWQTDRFDLHLGSRGACNRLSRCGRG
jgi:hypothetical protein